jgi:hypothetical protein
MQWNELEYSFQMKIIDRIASLLKEDDEMKDGIIAAIHELEIWSNSPCLPLEDERANIEEEPFISSAVDQEYNDKSN